jgi:hypothetical protein
MTRTIKAARQGRAPLEGSRAKGRVHPSAHNTRAGDPGPASDSDAGDPTARIVCGGVGRGVRRGEAPWSGNEKLPAIRRLYFETKPSTILRDFDRAIDILKSMDNEKDRERATVYMQGLAEMRNEWKRR